MAETLSAKERAEVHEVMNRLAEAMHQHITPNPNSEDRGQRGPIGFRLLCAIGRPRIILLWVIVCEDRKTARFLPDITHNENTTGLVWGHGSE